MSIIGDKVSRKARYGGDVKAKTRHQEEQQYETDIRTAYLLPEWRENPSAGQRKAGRDQLKSPPALVESFLSGQYKASNAGSNERHAPKQIAEGEA